MKNIILTSAPLVFLVGFLVFARFVARRLPLERFLGWRLFCIGALAAIGGLTVAVYLEQVKMGAIFIMVGAIISVIGIGRLLLSQRD